MRTTDPDNTDPYVDGGQTAPPTAPVEEQHETAQPLSYYIYGVEQATVRMSLLATLGFNLLVVALTIVSMRLVTTYAPPNGWSIAVIFALAMLAAKGLMSIDGWVKRLNVTQRVKNALMPKALHNAPRDLLEATPLYLKHMNIQRRTEEQRPMLMVDLQSEPNVSSFFDSVTYKDVEMYFAHDDVDASVTVDMMEPYTLYVQCQWFPEIEVITMMRLSVLQYDHQGRTVFTLELRSDGTTYRTLDTETISLGAFEGPPPSDFDYDTSHYSEAHAP